MADNKDKHNQYKDRKKVSTPNKIQENIFNRLRRKENVKVFLTNGDELVFKRIISNDNFTVIGLEEGEEELTMIYKHSITRIKDIPMTENEEKRYK